MNEFIKSIKELRRTTRLSNAINKHDTTNQRLVKNLISKNNSDQDEKQGVKIEIESLDGTPLIQSTKGSINYKQKYENHESLESRVNESDQ